MRRGFYPHADGFDPRTVHAPHHTHEGRKRMADHKTLKQRLREKREAEVAGVKDILYPLPDLKGPGGNAFHLLSQASRLMEKHNVSPATRAAFHSEATSGDYQHLLATLAKWFTLAVTETRMVPVTDVVKTLADYTNRDEEYSSWEEYDAAQPQAPEGLDEALGEYEENNDRARELAEVQDRINREVRADLGLADDEVVIVQVRKVKTS